MTTGDTHTSACAPGAGRMSVAGRALSSGGWLPPDDEAAGQVWEDILRPLAREIRRCAPDLTAASVARMRVEIPELFPDDQVAEASRAGISAHMLQLADTLEHGGDPRRFDLPEPGLALIRARVWRGVPLTEVMRLYRLAQEGMWQWMFTRITATAPGSVQLPTALRMATGWLFAYLDGAMIRAEHAYEVEREGWMRNAAAAQAAAIADIVADREHDPACASTRLRYEVNRYHLAAVVWLDRAPEHCDAQTTLGTAFAELARHLGAENTLTHPLGALILAGWSGSRASFSPRAFTELQQALPTGVRAAIGGPAHGLDGFRRSHLEAEHARRVATMAAHRADPVTRYGEIAVAALCTADPGHARAFVTRVLGRLAAPDETTYRLATTLSVFLGENGSRRRAADRLLVHPNTVSYRVQQAEAILGRSADIGTLELQVALAILPTLGESVAPGPDS